VTQIASLFVEIGADLSGLSRGLQQTDTLISRAGSSLRNFGAAMTLGVAVPLAGMGGMAANAAIEFESAFAGVVKTVDASEAQLGMLRDQIRAMATDASNPVAGLENAAITLSLIGENAGQLGVAVEHMDDFIQTAAMLDMTTNLTAESAATMSAQFANIAGMDLTNIDRFGATLVALGNAGASTEDQILGFALRLAGAGDQAGLTEAQILGLGSAMASLGLNEEAGGTAMTRVLNEMAKAAALGGENLQMFSQIAGMSADQFAAAWGDDAAGALAEFIEGLGGMSQAQQLLALEALGLDDVRVSDTLRRMAGNAGLLTEQLDLASDAWAENTALTVEAERRLETTAAQMNVLKNNVRNVGITVGGVFLPAINRAVAAIVPLLQRVAEANPTLIKLGVGFATVVAAVGPLVGVMGLLITPVGLVAGGLFLLGAAIAHVVDGADVMAFVFGDNLAAANRFATGLGSVIRSLEGGGMASVRFSTGLRSMAAALATVPQSILERLSTAFTNLTGIDLSAVGASIGGALNRLAGVDLSGLRTSVETRVGTALAAVKLVGADFGELRTSVETSIGTALDGVDLGGLDTTALLHKVDTAISGAFAGMTVGNFDVSGIQSALTNNLDAVINLALVGAAAAIGGPVAIGIGIAKIVASAIEADFLGIGTYLRESGISGSVEGALNGVLATIQGLIGSVFGGQQRLAVGAAGAAGAGGGLASSIGSSITAALAGAFDNVQLPDITPITNLLGGIFDSLKATFDPVLQESILPGLQDIGTGLQGFFAELGKTDTAGLDNIAQIFAVLAGAIAGFVTQLVAVGGDALGGILSGIGEALPALGEGLSSIISALSIAAETGDVGTAIGKLADGVGSFVDAVGRFSAGAADGLITAINGVTGLKLPSVDEGLGAWAGALENAALALQIVLDRVKRGFETFFLEVQNTILTKVGDLRQTILDATQGQVDIAPQIEFSQADIQRQLADIQIADLIAQTLREQVAGGALDLGALLTGETAQGSLSVPLSDMIAIDPEGIAAKMGVEGKMAIQQALDMAVATGDEGAFLALVPLAPELDIPIAPMEQQLQIAVSEAAQARASAGVTADVTVRPGSIRVDALRNAIVSRIQSIQVMGTGGGGGRAGQQPASFQHGGVMSYTGLAFLHQGERVLNRAETRAFDAAGRRGGDGGGFMQVNVYGESAFEVLDMVERAARARAKG
jgi:TP901 family phage tail tape measure protein